MVYILENMLFSLYDLKIEDIKTAGQLHDLVMQLNQRTEAYHIHSDGFARLSAVTGIIEGIEIVSQNDPRPLSERIQEVFDRANVKVIRG